MRRKAPPASMRPTAFSSGVDNVTHEAIHQFDKQGRKGIKTTKENISKVKENIQKRKSRSRTAEKTS